MLKIIMVLVSGILFSGLAACHIKTPEIHGIVLDEETKQPVEEAWIHSTLEIKTKTIQGNVYNVLSVDRPHTRTDSDGKFIIPSQKFKKPVPPLGFGAEVKSFGVSANTVDWKGGGLEIKDLLGKRKVELVIYIRSREKDDEEKINSYIKDGVSRERALEIIEMDYFSSLQALYNYCLTGRFSVEVPPVEGGCDEWELNYAITKHEGYLEKFPKTEQTRSHNTIILEQIGRLYEKKGELEKAIEYLKKAKEIRFFRPQDLEKEIEKIQQKLEGIKK